MVSENVIETDVLIIGGGLAGLFAAVKAREEGMNVTIVDKGYVSRSGASVIAAGFSVFNPAWGHNLNAWKAQVAKTGEYLNNPEWTEICLKESYDRYRDLLSWGVKFQKGKDGEPLRMPGMPRTAGVLEDITFGHGWKNLPLMRKQALKMGVNIIDRIMVTDLMKQDGRVVGAVGFNTRSGDFYVFQAKATVMCTGTGNLGGSTHIERPLTYDGEAMAYRAGATISGKEFAGHLYPVIDPETEGVAKVPMQGREFKLAPKDWHHAPMGSLVDAEGNIVSTITLSSIVPAVAAGRGPIYLDLDAAVTPEHMKLMPPMGEEQDVDLGDKIVTTQGGLYLGTSRTEMYTGLSIHGGGTGIWSADTRGATNLPGLYAAGDCYHSGGVGAVYPSSGFGTRNATVTGARAGRSAAEFASMTGKITIDRER